MPCRDYEDEFTRDEDRASRKTVDKLTAMLCEVMGSLSPDAVVSGELSNWWKDHQAEDARRREKEREQEELKELARKAMRKLNVEDIEALKFLGVTFPNNMRKALR